MESLQQQESDTERLFLNSIKSEAIKHVYLIYLQKYLKFVNCKTLNDLIVEYEKCTFQKSIKLLLLCLIFRRLTRRNKIMLLWLIERMKKIVLNLQRYKVKFQELVRRLQAPGLVICRKHRCNIRDGLKKVQDPDTGEFYKQRDKDGNIIKWTGPKHFVRQIVWLRTNDDNEYLYSNGYLIGFEVVSDPVSQAWSNPETWTKTGFKYKWEYDRE